MNRKNLILGTLAFMTILTVSGYAQDIPKTIHYQGNLADASGNAVNGNVIVRFKIYDQSGTKLWEETHNQVDVVGGLFHVELGSMDAFPDDLFAGERFLELDINGETLSPRQNLGSTPYAFIAEKTKSEKVIGNSETKDFGEEYEAGTDGFVLVYAFPDINSSVGVTYIGSIKTRIGPIPRFSTRGYVTAERRVSGQVGPIGGSFLMPVKKGQTWRVVEDLRFGDIAHITASLLWIPFSTE